MLDVLNCFKYFVINFGTKFLQKVGKKNLNYLKSLYAKLFQIFSNLYFGIFVPKRIKQKKLYQVFMYNFQCQNEKIFTKILELYQVFLWENVLILSHCIKTKSITRKQSVLFLFFFFFFFFHFLTCKDSPIF